MKPGLHGSWRGWPSPVPAQLTQALASLGPHGQHPITPDFHIHLFFPIKEPVKCLTKCDPILIFVRFHHKSFRNQKAPR